MSQAKKYEAIIFDLDGLMLDTESLCFKIMQRLGVELGYSITKELYIATIGREVEDVKQMFFDAFSADFPWDEIYKQESILTWEYINEHGVAKKPGLMELLKFLDSTSLQKAVGTSTHREQGIKKLEVTGLWNRFEAMVGGDEVKRGKPAPDIFLLAAERLGVAPEKCIVLEDSETGTIAANKAGMTPIIVPDMVQPSNEIKQLAFGVFPSLVVVKEVLQELCKAT
ncbi:HAD family phosphatase [Oligoflexia bacterium]|nr:HAD family phosphatase [Oligoflexia bacterium]